MDTTSLSTGTFYLGIVIGFLFGVAFAVARRALADFRGAKAAVPKAKQTWHDGLWKSIKVGAAVVGVVVLFGWFVWIDATGEQNPLTPAATEAPSPAASSRRPR